MTRYVVMPIAEARASGKRAAGFHSRGGEAEAFRLASTWCAQLNDRRRPDDRIRWDLHDGDTCAIVDTETPAPPAEERRLAAGWREALPGYYVLDVTATLTAHVERMANGAAWWTWVDGDSKRGRLEGGALAAAQLAAEDAAARLDAANARSAAAEAIGLAETWAISLSGDDRLGRHLQTVSLARIDEIKARLASPADFAARVTAALDRLVEVAASEFPGSAKVDAARAEVLAAIGVGRG